MGFLIRYEVSDLVIRQELITTGMHGKRERVMFFRCRDLSPKTDALITNLGYKQNQHGKPTKVRLFTYHVRSDFLGVHVEQRLQQLNVAEPTPEQIERAVVSMVLDKERAEASVSRATAASLARARLLKRQAITQLNTRPFQPA